MPQAAPANAKVEFENEDVRVLRVKIGGHKKLPMHEHPLSYVVTYFTDIHLVHYLPDGTREESERAVEMCDGSNR